MTFFFNSESSSCNMLNDTLKVSVGEKTGQQKNKKELYESKEGCANYDRGRGKVNYYTTEFQRKGIQQ